MNSETNSTWSGWMGLNQNHFIYSSFIFKQFLSIQNAVPLNLCFVLYFFPVFILSNFYAIVFVSLYFIIVPLEALVSL